MEENQEKNMQVPQETKGDTLNVPPRGMYAPPIISYGKLERRVLAELNKGYGAKRIARELGVSPSSVKRCIDNLRRKGLQIGLGGELLGEHETLKSFALPQETKGDTLGSWGTRNGQTHDLYTPSLPMEKNGGGILHTRAHNIKLKFPLQSGFKLPDVEQWKTVGLRNNLQYHRSWGSFYVILTSKSLLIEFPSVTSADANEYMRVVEKAGGAVLDELIEKYPALKVGRPEFKRQLVSQHHAIVDDPFAKWLQSKGITYSDGLFDVDSSTGREELEFTDKETAVADWSKYTGLIKDVVTNPEQIRLSDLQNRLTRMEETLSKTVELLNAVVQTQHVTTQHVELVLKDRLKLTEPTPAPEPLGVLYYVG